MRDCLRQTAKDHFSEQLQTEGDAPETQAALLQQEMGQDNEQADYLRNPRCYRCTHQAHFQREHKQQSKKIFSTVAVAVAAATRVEEPSLRQKPIRLTFSVEGMPKTAHQNRYSFTRGM